MCWPAPSRPASPILGPPEDQGARRGTGAHWLDLVVKVLLIGKLFFILQVFKILESVRPTAADSRAVGPLHCFESLKI